MNEQITDTDSRSVLYVLTSERQKPRQVTTTMDFLPLGLCLLVICTLGIIGNILSAVVLSRPKMKSTYSLIAISLAICDTVYLLTKFFRFGLLSLLVHFELGHYYTNFLFPRVHPQLRALNFTAQMASSYITVVLALDRYVAICWPLSSRHICTRRNAQILIFTMILFALIYNIPRWFEFQTVPVIQFFNKTQQNTTIGYTMQQLPIRSDPTYKTIYIFWSYFFIIDLLPFAALFFFNFSILSAIKKTITSKKVLTTIQKVDQTLAITLTGIVAMYLVCNAMFLVTDILDYIGQSYPKFLDQVANVLLTLNFAFNFIIYSAFGKKFRREFFIVMGKIICRKENIMDSSRSLSTVSRFSTSTVI